MVKEILIAPNRKLNRVSKRVQSLDKPAHNLFRNLKDTLLAQEDPEGIGLAAPQIGVLQRVFALKPDKPDSLKLFINPKITKLSHKTNLDVLKGKEELLEGCLSLPGIFSFVERPWEIEVEYLNEEFEKISKTLSGFTSIAFQHEFDHLEGILFTQRALEQGQDIITR